MFWLVILVVAAVVVYKFATHGGKSGDKAAPTSVALGSIWSGSGSSGIPIARFGNGYIYSGSGGAGVAIGRYGEGNIWRGSGAGGTPVGRYADGKIWEGSGGAGAPIARYADGRIWAGSGGVGIPIAGYDGESDGAAATAFIMRIVRQPAGFGMPVD